MVKIEVGLFGTCNDSKWREELIPQLNINHFNPVVDEWSKDAQEIEFEKRQSCEYILYTITPKMKGVYSIAEVVSDSFNRPQSTLFCVLDRDEEFEFDPDQLKSLMMVSKMVEENGVKCFTDLETVANYLNYVQYL